MIGQFKGKYRFLSNFYPVELMGIYPTVEHAYQATKTLDLSERLRIAQAPTPAKAKALGRRVKLRDDWELIKLDVMWRLLEDKFEEGSVLADLLIETGDHELVEGNTWDDMYWGVDLYSGRGENWLGRLLMLRRSFLVRHL